ncbi:hypothetical protein [Bergeyella sp. RCAD1439]|uniref:hypothetical protein n=1 Tax=Bergeyella anatis TaxID=3113737 RepID=UPI002E19AD7C|nr:hypothetical protein [Bergeyella sp. RCAD1439]
MKRNHFLKTWISAFAFVLTGQSYAQKALINKITFLQDDRSFAVEENSGTVFLERKPFKIRYFGQIYTPAKQKFYATQVAVLENKENTLPLGQSVEATSYFAPGTGMAPGENERYDTVYITNSGHHYLLYENEKEKRVDLVSKSKGGCEFEWNIAGAFYQDQDVPFSELPLSSLYFMIFTDQNLNGVIDHGELKTINVVFQ